MKKKGKKKMLVIIGVLLFVTGIITVFFNISYSKTKTEFSGIIGGLLTDMPNERDIFTEEVSHSQFSGHCFVSIT